jgi:hypothetical protein
VFTARHGHDFVRRQAFASMPAQAGKAIGRSSLLDLYQNDTAVLGALEVDEAPRLDSQEISNALRDRDLTFAGNGRAHANSLGNARFDLSIT